MVDRLATRWREISHWSCRRHPSWAGRPSPSEDCRSPWAGARSSTAWTWRSGTASCSPWWVPTVPASRRSSARSPETCRSGPAASPSMAGRWRDGARGSWPCAGRCCSSGSTSRSRSRSVTSCAWAAPRGPAPMARTTMTRRSQRPWPRPTSRTWSRGSTRPCRAASGHGRRSLACSPSRQASCSSTSRPRHSTSTTRSWSCGSPAIAPPPVLRSWSWRTTWAWPPRGRTGWWCSNEAASWATGRPREVLTEALLSRVYQHEVEVIPHPRTGLPIIVPRR